MHSFRLIGINDSCFFLSKGSKELVLHCSKLCLVQNNKLISCHLHIIKD